MTCVIFRGKKKISRRRGLLNSDVLHDNCHAEISFPNRPDFLYE